MSTMRTRMFYLGRAGSTAFPCSRPIATKKCDTQCESQEEYFECLFFLALSAFFACRWQSLMQVLNVSSFMKCLHNTDIPKGVFSLSRDVLKRTAIFLGLPALFDDDFEYIVRRSKFMVHQFCNPKQIALFIKLSCVSTQIQYYVLTVAACHHREHFIGGLRE
jgi:hypothetical protein